MKQLKAYYKNIKGNGYKWFASEHGLCYFQKWIPGKYIKISEDTSNVIECFYLMVCCTEKHIENGDIYTMFEKNLTYNHKEE